MRPGSAAMQSVSAAAMAAVMKYGNRKNNSPARVCALPTPLSPSLPTWHAGRVMLLGDAAQAMSPAGGQGASLALEDAMLVGKSLASGSRSLTEAFALVEAQLRARAERMVRQAAQNDLPS